MAVRIALRGPVDGLTIVQAPARPMPLDWVRWRDALIRGTPLHPIVEQYTVPEGWAVTIVEAAVDGALDVHAFYAVLDHAVHVVATLPADAPPAQRASARALFEHAAPMWDDAIVALVDL